MRAIVIRCPECGAQVAAGAGAATATCEYCGTTAQIQRRTGIFQRVEKPPAPPSAPTPVPGPARLPVAVQQANRGGLAAALLAMGVVLAVGPIAAVVAMRGGSTSSGPASLREPRWDGAPHGAALIDLTGDGVADVIGRVRVLQPEDRIYVAAFRGATGERLWMTEALGARSDVHSAKLGLADEVVLMSDGLAGVTAFALTDGSTRWTIRLSEKVTRFCAGEQGHAAALTADGALHPIALASGALLPAVGGGDCAPLPSDYPRDLPADLVRYGFFWDRSEPVLESAVEGLDASSTLHHVPSGVRLALGHRSPGSRVPMLASFRWPEGDAPPLDRRGRPARRAPEPDVLWTATIPAGDPLLAKEGAPDAEHVALGGGAVVIVYATRETHRFRLTALSLADGRRLWDLELPGTSPLSGVAASATHAFVSRWDGLHVYDLASGAHAYTIR